MRVLAGLIRGLRRRVRSWGGRLIRRAGLLPADQPDGLGEDDQLLGTRLEHDVMVFFADRPAELYQLESWYAALEALDKHRRVVIILQDSRNAKRVTSATHLDVLVIARNRTMDDLLSRSNVKAALYINYHPKNYFNLRFTSLVHLHLTHGDSDKRVTVSHQINAYDFALVAGQAAIDRLGRYATFFDAAARCIPIGRPQLDSWPGRIVGARPRQSGEPPTVLYAPTWEGALPSVRYGSVASHGRGLVAALMADGWRVIYRPHPLASAGHGPYAAADHAIREYLAAAAPSAAGFPHRVDVDVPLEHSCDAADLLICDISAVAVDWLAVDRPLCMTFPLATEAVIAASRLTETVPLIRADDVADVAALARQQIDEDPLAAARRDLIRYYLTDVTPGAATERFIAAVDQAIKAHAADIARRADRT